MKRFITAYCLSMKAAALAVLAVGTKDQAYALFVLGAPMALLLWMVLDAKARKEWRTVARELAIFPGSGGVGRLIERPDPRLGGESIAQVFRAAGGQIRQSWCGPCFGQGPDALAAGQRAITSFNRNWQNRMGFGGEGYLASPSVVAASALLGYMAPPSALGLLWQPETFGV